MTHHIIIGGGPAATNAVETIRQFDEGQSQVTLICDEPAHSRMALPYWLAGQIPREQTHTGDTAYFEDLQVDTHFGVRVSALGIAAKSLQLDNGKTLNFDSLLLATGSSPASPPIPGADLPGVHPLWSLADTEHVLQAAEGLARPRVVLVGAGFVGFIVLNAMFRRGWELTVVEREAQVLPRMLDADAAKLVTTWLDSRGVQVHTGVIVRAIQMAENGSKIVQLDSGQTIAADIVILATGVRPNVQLAQAAGLDVDHGILVDDCMRTSVPLIFAAGDVAQGPALYGVEKQVHAIQPTAVDHGRVAGANMAGHPVHYPGSLLMNVVDVCGLQCASFGDWSDADAEAMTISHPEGYVYRKLLWTGDRITGAIFQGRANDLGMLTDVGMVRGILQTQTPLGAWKEFLRENPFDIRRVYIAAGIAGKLVETTLLGRPARARKFQFGGIQPIVCENPAHRVFVEYRAN